MDNKVKMCKKLYKKSTCREKPTNEEVDDKYESMSSLIAWNISKVLKSNPNIDLKTEISAMQTRLESKLWDVNSVISDYPDQRYLACALLAWQQMGHGDASSLYQFIQSNLNGVNLYNSETLFIEVNDDSNLDFSYTPNKEDQNSNYVNAVESSNSNAFPYVVPIMKLPVETKIVMRCDMCNQKSPGKTPPKNQNTETNRKGDAKQPRGRPETKVENEELKAIVEANPSQSTSEIAASFGPCCIKSACKQRLVEMDASTSELKKRLQQLAKREEERQKLLTRAETAWRDLEKSYIRRLKLAEEKEEDISKQIKSSMEERNNYKSACGALAKQLEERGAVVQKDSEDLKKIEGQVCDRARKKFKITEDMACAESCLAQHHCRAAQVDRDLRFKEDQVRRKLKSLEDSAESYRGLRCEAERALRTELGALKEQVAKVSKRLLLEESQTANIKNELDELRVNKANILEDLDACKIMCDHHMQGQIAELKKKTEELTDIKDKLLECLCKLPQDTCVEVKRTPSLAAICRCSSEDNIQDSCSCSSLRTSLMTNLLKDLFGGLQSELGDNGSVMPCQLLKCLEDKHNWDRSTPVKTNLRSFFSKLLVGELDIAIASSIEKYHVKWVGTSCVDESSRIPNKADVEEWQQQALENRAQKLAKTLAEQLFQEKADQLIEKAKGIIARTPPPCQCGNQSPSTYTCMINPRMSNLRVLKSTQKKSTSVEKRIETNAMHVQVQVAEQKTKFLKKNTLKSPIKERNNTRPQRSYEYNTSPNQKKGRKGLSISQKYNHRAVSTDRDENFNNVLLNSSKKIENNTLGEYTKRCNKHQDISKYAEKYFHRPTQSYAVNLCLCGPQRDQNLETSLIKSSLDAQESPRQTNNCNLEDCSNLPFPYMVNNTIGFVKENSVENSLTQNISNIKTPTDFPCPNNCLCLNKAPSNTSLNKLLDTFLHDEIKNNLDDKQIINGLESKVKNVAKLNQDVFTNTDNENKIYKCQSTCVDALQFLNTDDFFPNKIKEIEDKKLKTNSKEVETNFYNKDFFATLMSNPNERTVQNNNKNNFDFENNRTFYKLESPTYDQSSKDVSSDRRHFKPTTAKSLLIQSNQKSFNLITNYVVDTSKTPLDSNCKVEFLGVTLSNNESKDINSSQPLKNVTSHSLYGSYCHCTRNKSQKKLENITINEEKLEKKHDDNFKDLLFKNKLLDKKSNCICCSTLDENQDLEMNTYELLTEYLQKKLEELKWSTPKTCFLPHEENLLYTDILNKVKNIILEMNEEVACECFKNNKNVDIDASWKRASSLLQEYLRIKINKIRCSCSVTMKNSKVLLPEMLEKVCQLIEKDFERLKMTYFEANIPKSAKNDFVVKENSLVDNMAYNELLKRGLKNKTSKIIIHSCGPPNNGNILKLDDKPSLFLQVHEPCENFEKFAEKNEQTVLPQLQTGNLSNSFYNNDTILNKKSTACQFAVSFNNILDEKIYVSVFPEENEIIDFSHTENKIKNLSVPYIGYTLDCPCDKVLGPCVCAKSTLKNNKNKSDNIWKVKPNKNLSYIMHSVVEDNTCNTKIIDYILHEDNNIVCDKINDTNFNEDDIKLKESSQKVEKSGNNYTNTSHIYIYDDVDYLSYDDWDDCESSNCPNLNETSSDKDKLLESLLLPLDDHSSHGRDKNRSDSDEVLKSEKKTQNCNCDMVPICHVKMLIDNIGRQLENSKCTCDLLHPNVCPVHFEI